MTINDTTSDIQNTEYERDPIWGAMSHPALDSIAAGSPPWKDHIYIAFWDPANEAYGFLHWNSSPNHDTTKVQANISLRGHQIDIIEPLLPQTDHFSSESAEFDLKSQISRAQSAGLSPSTFFVPLASRNGRSTRRARMAQ